MFHLIDMPVYQPSSCRQALIWRASRDSVRYFNPLKVTNQILVWIILRTKDDSALLKIYSVRISLFLSHNPTISLFLQCFQRYLLSSYPSMFTTLLHIFLSHIPTISILFSHFLTDLLILIHTISLSSFLPSFQSFQ